MDSISSNITINGITENGFVLPFGYTWDVNVENGVKEGKVTIKNEMGLVHAVLFYAHDKLNGLCCFYKNGRLIEKRTYVNNIVEGWSSEVDNEGKESIYIYKNGRKVCNLVKCEELQGFWKEIEIDSKNLVSICQYNLEHVKIGKCYLFEGKSIRRILSYDNGKEKDCIKEFNGRIMTEYDKGGNKIYIGGFENSLKNDYPRNGEGRELKDGDYVYYGKWKNNKRDGYGSSIISGFVYYEGEWKENLPHGNGKLFDENSDVKYNGNWVNGQFKFNENEWYDYVSKMILKKLCILSGDELMSLLNDEEKKKNVSEIVIEEECGNELKSALKICGFENLKKLLVKKNCLMNLKSLIISNNAELEIIEIDIGDGGWRDVLKTTGAFWNVKSVEISSIF